MKTADELRTTVLLVDLSGSDIGLFRAMLDASAPAAFEVARVASLSDASSYLAAAEAEWALDRAAVRFTERARDPRVEFDDEPAVDPGRCA